MEHNETISPSVAAPEAACRARREGHREDDAAQEENPPGCRIACRATGDRLAIRIFPGSSAGTRWFGLFAVILVGSALFVTHHEINAGLGLFPVVSCILVAVIWLFALRLTWTWLLSRFGTTTIVLEPGRLNIQSGLFGPGRINEYRLALCSQARLAPVHCGAEQPIYAVRIGAIGEQPSVGAFLSHPEKEWLACRINAHLGHADALQSIFDEEADPDGWSLMDGFQWGE